MEYLISAGTEMMMVMAHFAVPVLTMITVVAFFAVPILLAMVALAAVVFYGDSREAVAESSPGMLTTPLRGAVVGAHGGFADNLAVS